MKIRPLNDRVIVKPKGLDAVSKGGVILPDVAGREKPIEGVVLAAGDGHVAFSGEIRPLRVKEGDKIIFSKYAGIEVTLEEESFLVLREEDVIGIIE
jgi:chaperonin GroES